MVADGLSAVRARIAAAAQRAGRHPEDITLVAVSKGHGLDAIRAAYVAGHRDFGENRAAELAEKAPQLPHDIRWHFIGSLQRRKVKLVRPLVILLHSLDRLALVEAWARGDEAPPPALVQLNLAAEPQKHGAAPDEVGEILATADRLGVRCTGLMTIPPFPETPEDSRPWFDRLRAVQEQWMGRYPSLTELSMGMTDDFEVAIEAGATLIRVGTAIFGTRNVDA